jgi:hypothetical protein
MIPLITNAFVEGTLEIAAGATVLRVVNRLRRRR